MFEIIFQSSKGEAKFIDNIQFNYEINTYIISLIVLLVINNLNIGVYFYKSNIIYTLIYYIIFVLRTLILLFFILYIGIYNIINVFK